MIYTAIDAAYKLKPDAQWTCTSSNYSDFTWAKPSEAPSESEINAEIKRLNDAEPMRLLRLERNRRLELTDWRASSDLTLSTAWKTYRQSLRDLPASASPKLDSSGNLDITSVTFPTEPS